MHRRKKYVGAIIVVQPWFVLSMCVINSTKNRTNICFYCEFLFTNHSFNNLLRTVAVMHVEIYYRDFLDLITVLGHGVTCSDRYVIDKAKTVAACLSWVFVVMVIMESLTENACVVPRRSCCTESIPILATHDCVNCLYCGSCS